MNAKDKCLNLVDQYNKKLDQLKQQEGKIFDDIKKLNTENIKLNEERDLLLFAEGLEEKKLLKVKAQLRKNNETIKEKREFIEDIRESRAALEKRFIQEVTPLQKELYGECTRQIKEIGYKTQKIIDEATLEQVKMWDISGEYSGIISQLNSIGQANFSHTFTVLEYMRDATRNVFSVIPSGDRQEIKKDIESYNKVRHRYGNFLKHE